MNPANLIICMTPLQALIARHLIRRRLGETFDLLMLCYREADNAKFHHYFQAAAAHCRRARYVLIPPQKWRRELTMPRLTDGFDKHYRSIFAASIDNPHVQYPLNKLTFDTLETFDDGSGNLIPSSILYHNSRNPQRRLFNFLRRIRLQTEELRRLSCRHHTLYPGLPNITAPTVPLDLWQSADGFRQPENPAGSGQTIRILLGQPTFADAAANITLADTLLRRFDIGRYFPHPREHYRVSGADYIDSPLIFEDYLLQELAAQPENRFEIYHLASSAALNVHAFPRTRITAVRPALPPFDGENYRTLYRLMAQMGMEIAELPAESIQAA